ncbi:MAG: imidazoleglycerol-phosphate dehydratase HisB [Treponema sp.]|jgi:imidazoleglycerol-phosphate dehydratase|nr:imidazoleglycerol-phosphate dehydratase HisB [Treponema sp.]
MARIAELNRATGETDVTVKLNIDGTGAAKLDYPIGFMAHMLNAFARHGLFDLEVRARGDLETDQHHLVEDTGIVLGKCFAQALGGKRGIRRIGSCLLPMDEALARAAVDISGRPYLFFEAAFSIPLVSAGVGGVSVVSSFQVDTVEDFWRGFAFSGGITMHLEILRGRSDHHKIEALFKAAARALRDAAELDPRSADTIPSTKGVLV